MLWPQNYSIWESQISPYLFIVLLLLQMKAGAQSVCTHISLLYFMLCPKKLYSHCSPCCFPPEHAPIPWSSYSWGLLQAPSKPQPDSPRKQLGNSGSHLFWAWQRTLEGPFMTKPGSHLKLTISFKEKKLLFSDTLIPFSTSGGVHVLGMRHWGGGPLQVPKPSSLLVQYIDFSPTRTNFSLLFVWLQR